MSVILPDKPLIDTLPTPAAVRERLHQDRARAIMPRLADSRRSERRNRTWEMKEVEES